MIEAEDKEIDGHDFRYHPMMLKASRKQWDELAQRFGPAVAAAIEGLGAAQIDVDMELTEILGTATESAGGLLRGFVAGLDPKYHEKLADLLASQTQIKNEKGNYVPLTNDMREVLFGTHLLTEVKLIWWCLSVQYADFLGPLGKLSQQAAALRATAASALGSRPASTGSPTESPPATSTATP